MANRRMINGYIWEDDFFLTLSIFDRLLWIGVLTACADDQGRFVDNPALIRSKVFPMDDVLLADIDNGIKRFSQAGKIVCYEANKKKCAQVVNWWKHQTPRWAGESMLPAPPEWTDRYRYHASGGGQGGTIKAENWEKEGGFSENYIVNNTKPYVNDDINDDDDVDPNLSSLSDEFSTMTGILFYNNQKWTESMQAMVSNGVDIEILRTAYYDLTKGMVEQGKKAFTISGPWSLEKNAISLAAEKKQREQQEHKKQVKYIKMPDGSIKEVEV